eukprot:CAMPEP_0183748104 /NCGR_PEP_ID=MMETSP0737-20130205/67601_1 /TAXON_ID=385413 /ORGANISM="Thalassiosira miniscula, Strain CCMP1093" /LENGTH=38 /DNA_ID= /DNA_START= /DNA_END= /DNA_ORIENTATION=
MTFKEYLVRASPNRLNWNRCVKGFQDGISGSIQGFPPR